MHAYLDHASTSPLHPEALVAMLPFMTEHFGNPSSANAPGRRARMALDVAREEMAADLGCEPGELVFCSGGTEAAHLAVSGVMAARSLHDGGSTGGDVRARLICSAVEHPSVLRTVIAAGGATVRVGEDGMVDLDSLARMLTPDTSLVAVMLANNEVGTVQPVAEVAQLVRERAPDAVLFVDAVHAVCWLDVAELCACADMVSVSAHKFGGPKGSGALVVRSSTRIGAGAGPRWLPPRVGGSQERQRRPGTENVAGIAGMAAAMRVTVTQRATATQRVAALRDRLADALCSSIEGVTETGVRAGEDGMPDRRSKVAGSCHLVIEGVEQDELLFLLDQQAVYASAGSACSSGASEPSHVLDAMGVTARLAASRAGFGSALRLSLGPQTTDAEVDHAISVVPKIVEHLRAG